MTTNPAPVAQDLPLDGIRVLDLSRILAGPWCGQVLGDLGADVIKVEHPAKGDDTRDWGLPTGPDNTTYFNAVNRNKRSIGVDLAHPAGIGVIKSLAAKSDVVIQNFRTGGAEKLGIGYEALKAVNPGLVYCSIAGYASHTPEATRPGYDLVIQGEAGLMAMNGTAEQPPLKFGVAVVDLFTGQFAAQAVLAALFQRTRTGQGRHVELSLYDSGLSLTSYYGLEALRLGRDPARFGNAHPSIIPYGVFEAKDGPIVITVGNNAQFDRFCRQVIERADLADDPRFATNVKRGVNRAVLGPLIEAAIAMWERRTLLDRLTKAGIPCGEVSGLYDALTSRRTADTHMVVPDISNADLAVLAPPYRIDGARPSIRRFPPGLATHTGEVLRNELRLGDDEIAALVTAGAVAGT